MTDSSIPSDSFKIGERVLLIDIKKRTFLLTLAHDGQFHSHAGVIEHNLIIGQSEGITLVTNKGYKLIAFRPTLEDVIYKMPRGAQVIYPKDIGKILMAADVGPGLTVIESGVGSGALSMALLRCGVNIVGYEIREDFAKIARDNVTAVLGDFVRYEIKIKDIYLGIDELFIDRIILDLPEPQNVIPHAKLSLKKGGILVSYLPTINQVSILVETLREFDFEDIGVTETIERSWYVTQRSVRPDHRMVAHTGFIVRSRNT